MTAPTQGQFGMTMSSSEIPGDRKGPLEPLCYNLALLAHLIYLARRSETTQQQRYLEWASRIIDEMQHHPKLQGEP
jgi:rhamnogalacturonyl hydrolase YesR